MAARSFISLKLPFSSFTSNIEPKDLQTTFTNTMQHKAGTMNFSTRVGLEVYGIHAMTRIGELDI